MATQYTHNGTGLRYVCSREVVDYGAPLCQSLSGVSLDALITRLVLAALQPAALEISLQVAADVEGERARHHGEWQQRLERAYDAAERAARQYQAVEPEHRLVARTLEQQWEAALAAEAQLQTGYARFLAREPRVLSAAERARIRQLLERVIVTVIGDSERIAVEVQWIGGHRTRTHLVRPVARLEQLSYNPELVARVLALHQEGHTCPAIARQLNAECWRPAKRRATFNGPMIANLLAHQGVPAGVSPSRSALWSDRGPDEWPLPELARTLAMPPITLFSWLCNGWSQARQVPRAGHPQWLIWADAAELERLRARRQAPPRWATQHDGASKDFADTPS
jgi:hypothetical protein